MSWNLDLKIVIFKVLLLEFNNCHLLRSIKTLSIFYAVDVDEREIKKSQFFLILLIGFIKSDLIFLLVVCFGFCFVLVQYIMSQINYPEVHRGIRWGKLQGWKRGQIVQSTVNMEVFGRHQEASVLAAFEPNFI